MAASGSGAAPAEAIPPRRTPTRVAKGMQVNRQDRILRAGAMGRDGRAALDADEMLAAALGRAGREHFTDRSFMQPLERLIDSCNAESDLNALGRQAVRFEVRRSLNTLLQFERSEREDPTLLERAIERPMFITGMPRSGSTFLHRLLVQDPAVIAPLSRQLVYPYPSPLGRLGTALRACSVHAQFYTMRLLAPELNALHQVSPSAPEECTDITAQVFQSLRYDSVYRVPSYQSWLQRHGHVEAYRFHRRFLQHLDSQSPGRHWVLKSPDHVFALEEIREVYPDARWVFIHRDPIPVLASVAKLTEVLRRPFAHRVDLEEIGRQVLASWLDGAQRMMRAASGASADSILHIQYREIVSNPLETARRVFGHAGIALSARAEERMRRWLGNRTNRKHRGGRYDLAEFGLRPSVLRGQFATYTDAFGVELEWPARGPSVRALLH
jgi:hypothetical protein